MSYIVYPNESNRIIGAMLEVHVLAFSNYFALKKM